MTPLHVFLYSAKLLGQKPIDFWLPAEKQKTLERLSEAIQKLKKILSNKQLMDTHAFTCLRALEKTVTPAGLKEVDFIQSLSNLVDIYKHAPADKITAGLIGQLDSAVAKTKPRVLEHHLSLEHLETKAQTMSAEEKKKKDLETLQKIGVFYVLEYTLQVLYEFLRLSDADKLKLLKEGLKTKAGNLPAYYPLEDTFRKELCYKIFDEKLRHELLGLFYKFEEVLYNDNLDKVGNGLKKFNISMLTCFQNHSLTVFRGLVYAPFGNNMPVSEVLKKIILNQ